jgi:hypothetical protein
VKFRLTAVTLAFIGSFTLAACGDDESRGTSEQVPIEIDVDFDKTKTKTITPTMTPPPYKPATTTKRATATTQPKVTRR